MTHELKPRILVFGVGGAGGNAVDNMIEANLQGVEFIVANTDAQALSRSKTENRIQLGPETTSGLGAGARPDVGAKAAEESLEDIRARLVSISEELADLGIAALQTAIDEDGVNAKRPEAEKRLSRARRAVDKAAAIIGQTPESTTL